MKDEVTSAKSNYKNSYLIKKEFNKIDYDVKYDEVNINVGQDEPKKG